MSTFKRIKTPMHRYGDPDFDREYIEWGLHGGDEQRRQANSLLELIKPESRIRILDLACGIGIHAIAWAKAGHCVTGVDLSETFIAEANRIAQDENVNPDFLVLNINDMEFEAEFDVVSWIERSFFDENIIQMIFESLRPGGHFIFDDRNPENPKVKARHGSWRNWRENDGKFYLERHEINTETGNHEDAWITIDPEAELIEEKYGDVTKPQSLQQRIEILKRVGFENIQLRTIDGETYSDGPEPAWLWVLARK